MHENKDEEKENSYNYRNAVLELNASDTRGVEVVRSTIKSFAASKITLKANTHKIIILDEADNMTSSAQQSLRRIMDLYSKTTRFAFACNQVGKIIEPILSRCVILRYQRIPTPAMTARLTYVLKEEKVKVEEEKKLVLEALLFVSQGDLRKALNILETTWVGNGFVNRDAIYKIVDIPHPVIIEKILKACCTAQLWEAIDLLAPLCRLGYSTSDILETVIRILRKTEIPKKYKMAFLIEVAKLKSRISEGGNDSIIQLHGLLAKLCEKAREIHKESM